MNCLAQHDAGTVLGSLSVIQHFVISFLCFDCFFTEKSFSVAEFVLSYLAATLVWNP